MLSEKRNSVHPSLHIVSLQLYTHNLTVDAAQKTLDTAQKHRRKAWAKLTMVARGLEGIAFNKNIPDRRREMALKILQRMYTTKLISKVLSIPAVKLCSIETHSKTVQI